MTNIDVCEKTVIITTVALVTIVFWVGVFAVVADIIRWIG